MLRSDCSTCLDLVSLVPDIASRLTSQKKPFVVVADQELPTPRETSRALSEFAVVDHELHRALRVPAYPWLLSIDSDGDLVLNRASVIVTSNKPSDAGERSSATRWWPPP